MDRATVSLVAAPLVFGVTAFFTRAPARRLAAALLGGVAFAAGNVAWDVLAQHAGFWHYPGFGAHGPLLWYAAAGLTIAGVALIGWRVTRRFGRRGLVVFILGFALFGALRDCAVAHGAEPAIVFGQGLVPWLVDAAAWLSLMTLAVLIVLALGGELQRLRKAL